MVPRRVNQQIVEQSLLDFATGNEVQTITSSRSKVNQERQANQAAKTKLKEENAHSFLPSRARTMTLARRLPLTHSMLNYLSSIWKSTSPPLSPRFAPPAQTSPAPTPPSNPAVAPEMILFLSALFGLHCP